MREKVTHVTIRELPDYEPAANQFTRTWLSKRVNDPEKFKKMAIKKSQHILIAKDHQLVQDADIILVNLAINTPTNRYSVPSMNLPGPGCIANQSSLSLVDNWYCKHPFVVSTLSGTADTVEEAVDLIKYSLWINHDQNGRRNSRWIKEPCVLHV